MCKQDCRSYLPPEEGQYKGRCELTGQICNSRLRACQYKPLPVPRGQVIGPDDRVIPAEALPEAREAYNDLVGNPMS